MFINELTSTLENINTINISSIDLWRRQFKNMQEFQILHGINSLRTLILLNILKPSRMMSMVSN